MRAASRHFRRRGGKGLAIADLMSKVELTHGGFYKHFDSKQQLLAEAIAKGFDETEAEFIEAIGKAKPGSELKMITLLESSRRLPGCSPVLGNRALSPRHTY